jgi:hypothetical protein
MLRSLLKGLVTLWSGVGCPVHPVACALLPLPYALLFPQGQCRCKISLRKRHATLLLQLLACDDVHVCALVQVDQLDHFSQGMQIALSPQNIAVASMEVIEIFAGVVGIVSLFTVSLQLSDWVVSILDALAGTCLAVSDVVNWAAQWMVTTASFEESLTKQFVFYEDFENAKMRPFLPLKVPLSGTSDAPRWAGEDDSSHLEKLGRWHSTISRHAVLKTSALLSRVRPTAHCGEAVHSIPLLMCNTMRLVRL